MIDLSGGAEKEIERLEFNMQHSEALVWNGNRCRRHKYTKYTFGRNVHQKCTRGAAPVRFKGEMKFAAHMFRRPNVVMRHIDDLLNLIMTAKFVIIKLRGLNAGASGLNRRYLHRCPVEGQVSK